MKIRFLAHTYIRQNPADLDLPPLGVVFAGTILTVENQLYEGNTRDGISSYYRDAQGWYYWSGQGAVISNEIPRIEQDEITLLPVKLHQVGGAVQEQPSAVESSTLSVPSQVMKRSIAHLVHDATTPTPPVDFDEVAEVATDLSPTPDWSIQDTHPFWSLPLDPFYEYFWTDDQVMGSGVKVAIIGTATPTRPDPNALDIKGIRKFGDTHSNLQAAEQGIALDIIGQQNLAQLGVSPGAAIYYAQVPPATSPSAPAAWLAALRWLQTQQPAVLLLNDFFIPRESTAVADQLIADFAQRGTLVFAPIGEGRGQRPVNYWPARHPDCLAVGAYHRSGAPLESNQKSTNLDLLGPGETSPFRQKVKSPSSCAAAYLAGIAVLAREWANKRGIQLTGSDWRLHFLKATLSPLQSGSSVRQTYGAGRFHTGQLLEQINTKELFAK